MNLNELNEVTERQVAPIANEQEQGVDLSSTSYAGFKAPVPWEGLTEAERRAAYGGYLYPSWFPFAACEGNYGGSGYLDWSTSSKKKVVIQGRVNEEIEAHKRRFAVPASNKPNYGPAGVLKRA